MYWALIDKVKTWMKSKNTNIDCNYFLDYWNILNDLASSLGTSFYGNTDNSVVNGVYNKLFYGNNISAIKGEREEFIPEWSNKEISELNKVALDGIRVIEDYLLIQKNMGD